MLVVALFAAILVYIALGYIWVAAQPALNNSPAPALETIRHTLLGVPHETALAILKWGIILMAFYLITDALISALRRNPKSKTARDSRKDSKNVSSGSNVS
jgi:hypothetical protein